MADDLFDGLPPPSYTHHVSAADSQLPRVEDVSNRVEHEEIQPAPCLKSAFKRPKSPSSVSLESKSKKTLRFKTTTEASESEIMEVMSKVASHIGNPLKFHKASVLAVRLIEAGGVTAATAAHFVAILESAMSSLTSVTDAPYRSDYRALFSAAQDTVPFLTPEQADRLSAWTIHAITAVDLLTDDSFVFARAAGRVRDEISKLPLERVADGPSDATSVVRREGLIRCLEIGAGRYKTAWCQTTVDIMVKHAYDERERFGGREREGIEKLWCSVRERQVQRKQGKSVLSGKKSDVDGFEWLQLKYASEKISIRHAVGGSGDRRAEQWLG